MNGGNVKISPWFLYTVIGITIIVPLCVVLWIGVKGDVEEFELTLLKTSLNLFLLGGIGMLSKELFLTYSKQKIKEEQDTQIALQKEKELHTQKIEALNRLTRGYWGIKKALHIIMAHRSAKSYKEQMHLIIDYRLDIQQLNNELKGKIFGFNCWDEIANELSELDKQINLLVDEWTDKHLELAWQQKTDETNPPEKKLVPERIESLPKLKRVWEDIKIVHDPYQKAANLMRGELLGNTHI